MKKTTSKLSTILMAFIAGLFFTFITSDSIASTNIKASDILISSNMEIELAEATVDGKCGSESKEGKKETKEVKKEKQAKESKCGEGKCGEGKCGEKKSKEAKSEKKEKQAKESKCGGGTCA